MRNHLVVAALAILAAVAGGAALALWTEDGDTPAGVSGGDCDPAVQRSLDAWGGRGFSGSVAVSREGRFECVASLGAADAATGRPNTADTVFSIGSVSKSFAAAAVLKLAAAGRLRLSDRAGGLLPGLEGGARRVTVEQLLTHTSGLPVSHADDTQPMRRDEAVAAISGLRLAFRPGSGFLYSNAGYTLLALIVDEVSRTEYRRYLTAEVLTLTNGDRVGGFWNGEPAAPGERAIGYTERGRSDEQGDLEGPHWALTGNGDLAMSARALAVWTHALFAGDLLPARLLRTMTEGGFTRDDGGRSTAGWVRFDANVYGVPLVVSTGGGGSGQQAIVLWSPRTRQVIAAVSNRPEIGAVDLVRAIGPALLGGEPVPLPPPPVLTTSGTP
jgi:CubicO group peptidase (beta-lactamase class C family)